MRHQAIARAVRRGSFLSSTALLLLVGASQCAQAEPPAAALHAISQPSQPLSETLRSIARQTGASVLFDPTVVGGRVSRPVSGRLSAAEAISRAIDGSGLVVNVMKDGAIVVKPAAEGAPSPAPAGVQSTSFNGGGAAGPDAPVRLAQAPGAGTATDGGSAPSGAEERARGSQRIEITGSRLRQITSEGPMPVNTYTREDIDRSGQPTLERFLASLNESSGSPGEGAFGGTLGQATVQLRGLPLGSTLLLVNGRRVQAVGSSSANFFNLSLIPMQAIERVEIVPVGSSAVYGGDALAGVINVILKKSLDGQALSVRLGAASGTGDHGVSLATGGSSEEGAYLLMGAFSKSTPLTMSERDFFVNGDYRRFGGPDARGRSCTPGTVSSASGGNLPGLGSSFAGIPNLGPGVVPTVADFAPTAGQANRCNPWANGQGYALVHGVESLGLHALADRRLGKGWSVFGELTVAHERMHTDEIGLALTSVTVPATNPYNPFGETVQVTALLGPDNGLQGLRRETRFTRALLGLRGEFATNWDAEVTLSTTRDRGDMHEIGRSADPAALGAALGASSVDLALNPFATGRAASDEVLRAIWPDTVRDGRGRKDQASGFVRGELFKLPAGPMETIVGLEFSKDVYETSVPGLDISNSRRSRAAYGELRAPLWRSSADAASGGAWSIAALTLAARRDHYSDFGSADTYQAGLEVRPSRSVLLRASTATSFKPPTMLQTNVQGLSFPAAWFFLVDPARGNEPITTGEVVRAANPNLGPERGRAYTFGAVWEPEGADGTRLGVSAWRVKIDGLISVPMPQDVLNNEALFPGFVTREPSVGGVPGPVSRLLLAEANFGGVEVAGVDLEAAYAWRSAFGRWTLGGGATRTSKHRVQLAVGAPQEDRLGRRFSDFWAPEWKARLTAGLAHEAWSVGITNRYVGAYRDAAGSQRRLGDTWVHDLFGSVNLKKLGFGLGDWAKSAMVSLAVANATNRKPEFVETAPYFDVTQADWRGRYVSLQLAVDW
jgi:iron complex outermembrane receptor protein